MASKVVGRLLGVLLILGGIAMARSGATGATGLTGMTDTLDRYAEQRMRMVEEQIRGRGIDDPAVLGAFSRVPRHLFVPEPSRPGAYADTPLPIGFQQTISQPYIVALMTSLLDLKPGDRVLEIGTGSGYQSAVLAEMGAEVWTIEIVAPLGAQARRTLDHLGYRGVRTRVGDGYQGWPEAAPFDAIVVTAAPPQVPKPLLDQVKVGGRLVVPVGDGVQDLVVFTKRPDGSVEKKTVLPVRFVPMTGEAQRGR